MRAPDQAWATVGALITHLLLPTGGQEAAPRLGFCERSWIEPTDLTKRDIEGGPWSDALKLTSLRRFLVRDTERQRNPVEARPFGSEPPRAPVRRVESRLPIPTSSVPSQGRGQCSADAGPAPHTDGASNCAHRRPAPFMPTRLRSTPMPSASSSTVQPSVSRCRWVQSELAARHRALLHAPQRLALSFTLVAEHPCGGAVGSAGSTPFLDLGRSTSSERCSLSSALDQSK
jgi:hypothetical protein